MRFAESLRAHKFFAFAPLDAALTALSLLAAFYLRFDLSFPPQYADVFWTAVPVLAILNIAFLLRYNLYSFTWSFVGLTELGRLIKALTFASAFFALAILADRETTNVFAGFPRSVVLIGYILNVVLIGGVRIGKRLCSEIVLRKPPLGSARTIVVGAGSQGEQIIRSLRLAGTAIDIVGIIDPNPAKQNTLIHNIRVIGRIDDIPSLVVAHRVESVVIALGEAHGDYIRKAVRRAREARVQKIKIIPQFSDLLGQKISFEALRDVSVEDLLGRDPVQIDTQEIRSFVNGKRVLVTGAAGSIGSEICRQLVSFGPHEIFMLDFNESGLFDMEAEFKMKFPEQAIRPLIASITNTSKIKGLFQKFRPEVVFHAAAYKHVPLMEEWPDEAVATNIFGTAVLAEAAREANVKKFVLISTDKAVNPTSIMGQTKRAAELVVQAENEAGPTRFVSVRFGNVLGSRGSVVPLFEEQIRRRAPITVTHPEMQRYFMTIPEAALLVLEAGAVGSGGEVFILDMGKPVKIVDLARELIHLSGLEPDKDIPIVFTEVRPGEKLFEELLTAEERAQGATKWQKIFVAQGAKPKDAQTIRVRLRALQSALHDSSTDLREKIRAFIE